MKIWFLFYPGWDFESSSDEIWIESMVSNCFPASQKISQAVQGVAINEASFGIFFWNRLMQSSVKVWKSAAWYSGLERCSYDNHYHKVDGLNST